MEKHGTQVSHPQILSKHLRMDMGVSFRKKKAWLYHAMQSRRRRRAEGLLSHRPFRWCWFKHRDLRHPPQVAASFESLPGPGLF